MNPHFCPNCGEALEAGAHFCAACGHHLPDEGAAPGEAPTAATPVPPPPGAAVAAPAADAAAPPPGEDGKRTGLVVAVSVLAVLVLALGGFALYRLLSDDDGEPVATTPTEVDDDDEVLLEPVAVEVPDPFTASVAQGEATLTDLPTTETTLPDVATGAAGGAVNGSAPGLYGGTRDRGSCDPEQLIDFLQENPDKAAAWAGVQGIEVADIPDYIRSLTPVVLRRDTRVLNHGFTNGRATPRAAVLQAGTAVLVDDKGIPRVKCNCGNPLDEPPPVTTKTRYVGNRWEGFSETKVVVVRVDITVEVFVLIDITTGIPFDRPVGTTGDADADDPRTTTTTTTTTRPTTTTTRPRTTTTAPPSADRSQEAIAVMEASLCPDSLPYVSGYRAYELRTDRYRVEVDITLDSGSWTAYFDVEFASEFPLVEPQDSESAALLC